MTRPRIQRDRVTRPCARATHRWGLLCGDADGVDSLTANFGQEKNEDVQTNFRRKRKQLWPVGRSE